MIRVSYVEASISYPDIYAQVIQSLTTRLPFLKNPVMRIALIERAQMLTFRTISHCYVNNMEEIDKHRGEGVERGLEHYVREQVDFTFVDETVRMYVSLLLFRSK